MGGGTINYRGKDPAKGDFTGWFAIKGNGNLWVGDNVTLRSSHGIIHLSSGVLTIASGIYESEGADTIYYGGKSNVNISGAKLYNKTKNSHVLAIRSAEKFDVTINNSFLGNGQQDITSKQYPQETGNAISTHNTGNFTVKGSTKIIGGHNSETPILKYGSGIVSFTGNSSLYSLSENQNTYCINVQLESGTKSLNTTVTFNSIYNVKTGTGSFHTKGNFVAHASQGVAKVTFNFTKGSFASSRKTDDNSLCYNAGAREYNGSDANVYYWRWLNSSSDPIRGTDPSLRTRLLKK